MFCRGLNKIKYIIINVSCIALFIAQVHCELCFVCLTFCGSMYDVLKHIIFQFLNRLQKQYANNSLIIYVKRKINLHTDLKQADCLLSYVNNSKCKKNSWNKEHTKAKTSRGNGFSRGQFPVGRTAGSTSNLQNNKM